MLGVKGISNALLWFCNGPVYGLFQRIGGAIEVKSHPNLELQLRIQVELRTNG